jgi:hypothetical protein
MTQTGEQRKGKGMTYPRITEDGRTVWACCESSIGPDCQHKAGNVDHVHIPRLDDLSRCIDCG